MTNIVMQERTWDGDANMETVMRSMMVFNPCSYPWIARPRAQVQNEP
jgi:hypothetical protein